MDLNGSMTLAEINGDSVGKDGEQQEPSQNGDVSMDLPPEPETNQAQ